MTAFIELVILATATCLALGIASALQWLVLHCAMRLMHPAAARQSHARPALVRGTVQLARAYAPRR